MVQWVKNPPAMQETQEMQVQSLGWEDTLEKEMATHSSILAWRVPCTEEPGRLQSLGLHRIIHDRSDLACTQSLFAVILEPKEIKSVVVSTFPPLFAQSDGTRCHDLRFLNVES